MLKKIYFSILIVLTAILISASFATDLIKIKEAKSVQNTNQNIENFEQDTIQKNNVETYEDKLKKETDKTQETELPSPTLIDENNTQEPEILSIDDEIKSEDENIKEEDNLPSEDLLNELDEPKKEDLIQPEELEIKEEEVEIEREVENELKKEEILEEEVDKKIDKEVENQIKILMQQRKQKDSKPQNNEEKDFIATTKTEESESIANYERELTDEEIEQVLKRLEEQTQIETIENLKLSDIVQNEDISERLKFRIRELINIGQKELNTQKALLKSNREEMTKKISDIETELNLSKTLQNKAEHNAEISRWMILTLSMGVVCLTFLIVVIWRGFVNANKGELEVLLAYEDLKKNIAKLSERIAKLNLNQNKKTIKQKPLEEITE